MALPEAKYTRRREELGSIGVREFVAAVRKESQLKDDENDDELSDEDDGENHLGKLEIAEDESIESEDKCAIEEGVQDGEHVSIDEIPVDTLEPAIGEFCCE